MGLREDAHGNRPIVSGEKVKAKRSTAVSVTVKRNKNKIIIKTLNKFLYCLLML